MRIYVPSRSRASRFVKGTVDHVPSGYEVRVVVPQEQAESYARELGTARAGSTTSLGHVRILPTPAVGIARTRHWIGEYARRHDESCFLMLDDDLHFCYREDPKKTGLKQGGRAIVAEILAEVERSLHDYAAVGVSARQGNNHVKGNSVENTRLIRALAFQTTPFLGCEHGRVDVMEDFDVLLQLLRAGRRNLCLYRYAQDQRQTQDKGGCSDYRTQEIHTAAAERLAELHPGFVRLREKTNKTGGEFGTRTEVTIAWKKAYDSSQQESDDNDNGKTE